MDDHTTDTPLKRCPTCGKYKPANAEFFARDKSKKDGLSRCRECKHATNKRYRERSPDKIRAQQQSLSKEKKREYSRRAYEKNKDQRNARSVAYAKAHPEKRREIQRRWRDNNPDYDNNYYAHKGYHTSRRYYVENKSKKLEYQRKYRALNLDRVRAAGRRYYLKNIEVAREKHREWKRNNRNKVTVLNLNRSARKRDLPNTLTSSQWLHAIDYFNGCCAVCGRQLRDLFSTHTVAADHWIPLSDPSPDNPGTVATNILPLCHGQGGCNNRKGGRDPVEFLKTEFGNREATKILKRIHGYFSSLHTIS